MSPQPSRRCDQSPPRVCERRSNKPCRTLKKTRAGIKPWGEPVRSWRRRANTPCGTFDKTTACIEPWDELVRSWLARCICLGSFEQYGYGSSMCRCVCVYVCVREVCVTACVLVGSVRAGGVSGDGQHCVLFREQSGYGCFVCVSFNDNSETLCRL